MLTIRRAWNRLWWRSADIGGFSLIVARSTVVVLELGVPLESIFGGIGQIAVNLGAFIFHMCLKVNMKTILIFEALPAI